MANKFIKTGYTVKCANPNCPTMIYKKKSTYENSPYKLFCCSCECKNSEAVIKMRTDKFEQLNGYRNVYQRPDVIAKIKKTNRKKYGAENVFASNKIKEKIKNMNIKKYGVSNPMQSAEIQRKAMNTRIEKYGAENLQGCVPRQALEETCLKKYGFTQFFSSDVGKMSRENLKKRYNYSDDEIDKICKSRAVTLEALTKKHGADKAKTIYECWLSSIKNTKENFILRHGEELGIKKWDDYISDKVEQTKNRTNFGYVSKISMELFDSVCEEINDSAIYGENEWYLIPPDTKFGKIFFYDFKFKNKLIEFNGDYWHANPKYYNKDDSLSFPNKHTTAENIWKKDAFKIKLANDMGFDILTIWESDYHCDKKSVVVDAVNFLMK